MHRHERALVASPHVSLLMSRRPPMAFRRQAPHICMSSDTTSVPSLQFAFEYCSDLVRRADLEHFLCGLRFPTTEHRRHHFYAIRAFNIELARIADVTQNPQIASMRFLWWQTMLDEIYTRAAAGRSRSDGQIPSQPVAQALAAAIAAHGLPRSLFDRVLHHRQRDIEVRQLDSMTSIETYGEATQGSLLQLAAAVASPGAPMPAVRDAASHIGQSLAFCILLRATPHHAKKGKVYLPTSLTAKYGVSDESLVRFQNSGPLAEVVFRMADLAKAHLDEGRKILASDDLRQSPSRIALLPAAIADVFLMRLEKARFNIFDPDLQADSRLPLQWRILKAQLGGRFV